jgi:hypothetical protein
MHAVLLNRFIFVKRKSRQRPAHDLGGNVSNKHTKISTGDKSTSPSSIRGISSLRRKTCRPVFPMMILATKKRGPNQGIRFSPQGEKSVFLRQNSMTRQQSKMRETKAPPTQRSTVTPNFRTSPLSASGVAIWSKIGFVVDFRNLLFGCDFDLSFSKDYSLMKMFNYEVDFTAKCDT